MNLQAMGWLVRRELWENRALYIVPLALAGLLLFAAFYMVFFGISATVRLGAVTAHMTMFTSEQLSSGFGYAVAALAVPFNLALISVVYFYLLDALYSERKNRSIMFFRSLPVTDTTTVLSKLVIAAVVAPAITLVVVVASALALWVIETAVVAFNGGSVSMTIAQIGSIISGGLLVLYIFVVQSLWYAPLFGWLLLASAWARRAPFLWAVLPPAALVYLESLLFKSSHVAHLIGHRLTGHVELAIREPDMRSLGFDDHMPMGVPESVLSLATPGQFLTSGDLWLGLIAAAGFLAGAVWLRRYRDEG